MLNINKNFPYSCRVMLFDLFALMVADTLSLPLFSEDLIPLCLWLSVGAGGDPRRFLCVGEILV